jgi:hypothetical protein
VANTEKIITRQIMPRFMYRLMYWLWPRMVVIALVGAAAQWVIEFLSK